MPRRRRSISRWALAVLAAVLSTVTVLVAPVPAEAAAPPAPASVTLTPGRRAIKVDWTAPVSPGGTISGYKVTVSPAPGDCTTGGTTYTCTISGVTANTQLTVSVVACISTDCSPAKTATTRVGPPATPQAPVVTYTNTTADQKSMHLSWGENDLGAGVSSYRVTSTPAFTSETGSCTTPVVWPATSCDVNDMQSGTSYTFKLTAIGVSFPATGSTGSSAVGPASTPKYTGVPPTPSAPEVVRTSDSAVTVTWTKPTGVGATVGGYTVRETVDTVKSQACVVLSADVTTCDVSGLNPAKSYTFAVSANGEGTYGGASAYSSESGTITPGRPGQPDAPSAELGASVGQVTVRWTAPTDGGSVTGYRVDAIPADEDVLPPDPCPAGPADTHCDFTGLQDGESYTFTVTALGAVNSAPSAPSDPIVSQLPGQAGTPTVTLGDKPGTVQLTWDKPDSGGQVIYYTVTPHPWPADATLGKPSGDCGFNLAAPSCTITDLDPTASYTFTVTSVGDLGTAESPASGSVVPDQPGAVTTPTVSLDSSTQATVNWTEPTTGGAVDHYEITATPTDGSTAPGACTKAAEDKSCTFTSLNAAKSYDFKVEAFNDSGSTPAKADATDVPIAPTGVNWTMGASAGTVTVNWAGSGGDIAPSQYVVTSSTSGVAGPGCSSVGTWCDITGLDSTKSYTFTVRGQNILGGHDSSASPAVIAAAPGQPTGVTAKATASGQVTVTWTAPVGGGTIDHFEVSPDPDDVCSAVAPDATQCVVTGLGATGHTFTVSAVNNITATPSSATGSVVAAATVAPTGVTARLGDTPGKVIIDWIAPTTGGTVTSYVVQQTLDGSTTTAEACKSITPPTTTCTLTGLSPTGSYTFLVQAKNDLGPQASEPSTAIVPDKPSVPTSVHVSLGVDTPGKVTVSWLDSTGGGAVDHYKVTAATGGVDTASGCASVVPGAQVCVITGLDRTKTYVFKVAAVNDAGPSTATSGSVVPDQPGAAQDVKAVAEATPGTVTVTWAKPGGGEPETYQVVAESSSEGAFLPDPCDVSAGEELTCTFEGLTPDAAYDFIVSATNASGTSEAEPTEPLIPNKPGRPDMVRGEVTASDTVRLTWQAPQGPGGPLASYYATAYATDAPDVPIPADSCDEVTEPTCLFTGLNPDKSYTFTVTAVGPGGAKSDESYPTGEITTAPPAPPPAPHVELYGANAVRLTWDEEPESGGPVWAWSITSDPAMPPGGECGMTDKGGCVFPGLTSGIPYRFTLIAHGTANRDASSVPSAPIVPGPPDTPARPTVKATANAGEVTVSWFAPDEGAGIAGYQVQSNPGLIGCAKAAGPDATSCVVNGLTPGVSYRFRVQALGVAGSGDSALSASSEPIVPQAPGRPTNVDVLGGDRQIAVSWTVPDLVNRVAYYVATATPGGATCQTKTGADTECVITGLQNATTYTVVVTAVGTAGLGTMDSRPSARVRPTAGTPGSPTGVGAKGGDGVAVVTWTAPAATGDGIARYTVTATDAKGVGKTCVTPDGNTLTCTVTGLTNLQKYTVTVVSVGRAASGNSRPSDGVDVTPSVAPGAPGGVKVTPGSKTLEVKWTAGSAGSGIGGYTVTAVPTTGTPTPITCTTDNTASTCSIANVTPGTAYDVTVTAAGMVAGVTSPASDKATATAILAVPPGLGTTAPVSAGTLTVTAVGSTTAITSVKLGASVTITGTGYAPFTGVSIGMFPGPVSLTTAVTDSTGKFSVSVPITGVSAGAKPTIVAGGLMTTTVKYRTAAITVLAP